MIKVDEGETERYSLNEDEQKQNVVFEIVNNSVKEITQIGFEPFAEPKDLSQSLEDNLLFKKMYKVQNVKSNTKVHSGLLNTSEGNEQSRFVDRSLFELMQHPEYLGEGKQNLI